MKYLLIAITLLSLQACTDAEISQWTTVGSSAHVICFSGGKTIGEWESTGKVSTEKQSDGWFFKDSKSGKLIRVSGTCIVEN